MDLGALFISLFGLGEGLPAALTALQALRSGGSSHRHPGADLAYIAYQGAMTDFLFHLHTMVEIGIPPKMLGGLWSWPAVLRSNRGLYEAMNRSAVAFGQIIMFGSYDVGVAGYELAVAAGAATSGLKVNGLRRVESTPDFQAKMQGAWEAMRAYLLTVRTELDIPALLVAESPDDESMTAE